MSLSPSPQFSTHQSSASGSSTPQSSAPAARRPLIARAFLLAALLVTAAGAALASAPAAQAHDELLSTNPAAGAQLDTAPAELELTFSSALMDLGNQVQVLDAEGRNWAETAVVLNRETLIQPLPGNMPNGVYSVSWRAVSSDGHPITGTFEFAVGTGTGTDAAGPEASAGAPETAAATESADAADTAPADATETVEAIDASDDGGRPAWLVPGIIGGVTGLVLYAVYTFVSRRRQRQAAERKSEE